MGMLRGKALVIVLLMPACAGTPPPGQLNRAALKASQPRTIVLARHPPPDFLAWTASGGAVGALFGPLGILVAAAASEARGNALAQKKAIEDPAIEIGDQLTAALARRYSLTIIDTGALDYTLANADLVLHVRTWEGGCGATRLSGHYGIHYAGTLELFDARAHSVLAQGGCSLPLPEDSEDAPTYDRMVANNGAVLKAMLHSVAETCADGYRRRLLGLYQ